MNLEKKNNSIEAKIYRNGSLLSLVFITIAIIGFALILIPSFFTNDISNFNFLIGGFLSPLIAIAAALLTFLAFYIQFKANLIVQEQFITQQKQFEIQQKQLKLQQFESQFFEMVKLHKENINEMKITGYDLIIQQSFSATKKNNYNTEVQTLRYTEGRKVFVTMETELFAIFEFLIKYNSELKKKYKMKDLFNYSYQIFFFGSNSTLLYSKTFDKAFIKYVRKNLNEVRKIHKESSGKNNEFSGLKKQIGLYIKYSPFTGHESRLGHYYRHLFSAVKYVVKKENEGLFDYYKSREYLKILRSQMSNDEQLMFYYNYLAGYGKKWENSQNKFFSDYRMLHNLPLDKTKYENPRKHFKAQILRIRQETNGREEMFEWDEK